MPLNWDRHSKRKTVLKRYYIYVLCAFLGVLSVKALELEPKMLFLILGIAGGLFIGYVINKLFYKTGNLSEPDSR